MAKVVEGYLPGKQRGTHELIADVPNADMEKGDRVIVERIEGAGFIVKDLKGKVLEHYEKNEMHMFNLKYKSVKAPNEKAKAARKG